MTIRVTPIILRTLPALDAGVIVIPLVVAGIVPSGAKNKLGRQVMQAHGGRCLNCGFHFHERSQFFIWVLQRNALCSDAHRK
jgi:hypothetical protein